jgi:lipopolysaccharide/colanic/teichoic acid biosynthesis glycosyltransferase/anti-sigma regulatory factor (Ser/Thr protein kinase)
MMATNRWIQPLVNRQSHEHHWIRHSVTTLSDLPAVLDAVVEAVRAAGGSLREQFAIRLVLEEAVVNALRHGHRDDDGKVVRLCYQITKRHWLAVVSDEGTGFPVKRVLQEPGRGIALMRRYLSWLCYSGPGNRVTLCKYFQEPLQAPSEEVGPSQRTPLPFQRPGLIRLAPRPARKPQPSTRHVGAAAKRAVDVCGAIGLLLVCLPVMLAAALLTALTSRGGAIYWQTRVGRGGRPFTLYKLRTMTHDCEKWSGPQWSTPGDLRVTGVGRLLRWLHIDELPQLWNVLRGDMSLVGPRPERPEFTRILSLHLPRYDERVAVLPGLTGLAQVQLPPDATVEDVRRKLTCDLLYVEKQGLWLDVRLFAATALKLLHLPERVICTLCCLPSAPPAGLESRVSGNSS